MSDLHDAVHTDAPRLEVLRALRAECARRLLDPDTPATAAASLARRVHDLTDAIEATAPAPPDAASPEAFVDGLRLIVGGASTDTSPGAGG